MSALTRYPSNPNPLQPNKFLLNFNRSSGVQYFCQSVSVPGISMGEALYPNPFVDLYAPGDKVIYEQLLITFIVDEELRSWMDIHDWIRAMTFPKEFAEYRSLEKLARKAGGFVKPQPQYSDASLTLLSSANKPYIRFKFYDVFPTSLSTFIMDTKDSPQNVISADATFRYNYYDIEKLY